MPDAKSKRRKFFIDSKVMKSKFKIVDEGKSIRETAKVFDI